MTTASAERAGANTRRGTVGRVVRRHGWTVGVYLLLGVLVLYWRSQTNVPWGQFDVQSLAIDTLPLAFAACGQAIVIISGGIDLSVGSMMGLVNVVAGLRGRHVVRPRVRAPWGTLRADRARGEAGHAAVRPRLLPRADGHVGNASTPASWLRAVELIESRSVALEPLLSEAIPLVEWERAFAATRAGEGIKYVLVP